MLRILAVVAVAALVGLAIWHPAPGPPVASPAAPASPMSRHALRRGPAASRTPDAVVFVAGAVRRPGLYHVADGARIDDAIRAAGGERSDADPVAVNLAAHASDGDEIFVPVIGEATLPALRGNRARAPRTRAKTHSIVDVNRASAQTLASVPGIGATIAARIVQIREADGNFATLDELLDVAGMTQSRLDRARAYLRL